MSRLIKSHSVEYPTARDVFRAIIEETLKLGEDSWGHFDDADSSVWAEIRPHERGLLVNLPYPYREEPEEVFAKKGLSVPDHWQADTFRRKGFLTHGYITYLAPQEDLDRIIAFLDRFFTCMSEKGPSYHVSGDVES